MVNIKPRQRKPLRRPIRSVAQYGGGFDFFYCDAVYRADTSAQIAANAVLYLYMQAIVSIFGEGELGMGIVNRNGPTFRVGESLWLRNYPRSPTPASPRMPQGKAQPTQKTLHPNKDTPFGYLRTFAYGREGAGNPACPHI